MATPYDPDFDGAWYTRCAAEYERAAAGSAFPFDESSLYPCDDRAGGASFDRQYMHADLWAARAIIKRASMFPHLDVGSRLDGLVTHLLAADVDVEHVDIRDPFVDLGRRFHFRQDDMRTLASVPVSCGYSTVSCIHAAEHAGLGRYNDEIDPHGMERAMAALARVLVPGLPAFDGAGGGRLYFAVPVGRQRVVFNAHRVASPSWVIETFASHGLNLESFAAVDDEGRFHEEARPSDYESASYSCGMFELSKRGSR